MSNGETVKKPRLDVDNPRKRVAVLISGAGSNLKALLQHTGATTNETASKKASNAEIVIVISNRADAGGLKIAREAGVETAFLSHKSFATRDEYDAALDVILRGAGIEFICLAGFMRILGRQFVESWKGRILNVHPSLLPSFKGTYEM